MEKWDAYDKNRQKTGQLLKRGETVPEGLYHLVVNVFVRHQDGDRLFILNENQTLTRQVDADRTEVHQGDLTQLDFDLRRVL